MECTVEQKVNVNFCVKLQKSPSETSEMLKAVTVNPLAKKPWMSKSKIKTMLIYFFNIRGSIHFESVPEGTTVNQTFYVEVLKRFIDVMRCKGGELWRDQSLILHHDNMQKYSLLQMSQ
jgi:hypothetical protein